MQFEFQKEYETGVLEIDAEHREFFRHINDAVKAMDLPHDEALAETRRLLEKVEQYTIAHIEHEETYMRETHDAELPAQIQAHQHFLAQVEGMMEKKDQLELKDLGQIFIFMAKWLRGHIIAMDTLIGKTRASGRVTMTQDFFTGIEFVDEEHAVLFDIIGRIYDTINDEMLHDRFDAIMDILAELKQYTERHFADEEAYMEKIGYDGLDLQKAAHTAFVEKVSEVDIQEVSDAGDDQNEYLLSIVRFLNSWLVNHILKMDKKIPAQ